MGPRQPDHLSLWAVIDAHRRAVAALSDDAMALGEYEPREVIGRPVASVSTGAAALEAQDQDVLTPGGPALCYRTILLSPAGVALRARITNAPPGLPSPRWRISRAVLIAPPTRLLNATEAARFIGVSRAGFYRLLDRDPTLAALRLGGMGRMQRVYLADDLDAWAHRRTATTQVESSHDDPSHDDDDDHAPSRGPTDGEPTDPVEAEPPRDDRRA